MIDDHEFLIVLTGAQKPSGLWMEICTFIHFTFHFPLAGYHDEFCPGAFRQSHRKRKMLGLQWFGRAGAISLSHKRSFGLESWPPCLMLQVYYRLGSLLKRLKGEADEERQKAGPTLFTWKHWPKFNPTILPSFNLEIQTYADSPVECQELELQEVLKAKAQFVSGISDGLKRSENQFWCAWWLTMVDSWISESI